MKPALSIMIRVGPSRSFSSNLNEFHSKSNQSSPLYTNVAASAPAPTYNHLGSDNASFTIANSNVLIGSVLEVGSVVSGVYMTVTKVSGGFQATRDSGFSALVASIIPPSVLSGSVAALVEGELVYFRLDDLTPAPAKSYSYYAGSSGSSPRDIIVVNTAYAVFNPATKTITGQNQGTVPFDLLSITISSTISQFTIQRDLTTFVGNNSSYSSWSGSSIGGTQGGYKLVFALSPDNI